MSKFEEYKVNSENQSSEERERYEIMNQLMPPSEKTYDNEKRLFAREEIEYDNLVHAMNIYEFYQCYENGLFTPYDGYGKLVIVGKDKGDKYNPGIDAIEFCTIIKVTIGILGHENIDGIKFSDFYDIVYNHLYYKIEEYEILVKPGIFVAWYNK